jgi:hypothetical protein
MTTTDTRIRAFWQWFECHLPEFRKLSKPDEAFWDIALEQIKKVDERLWIELSATDDAVREFIVTASGHVEAFPIVDALVNLAPKIDHWDFKALKPPMGFGFTTRYEGTLFDPRQIWFLPLESSSRPQDFGMRVGIQGLNFMSKTDAHNAILVNPGYGPRRAVSRDRYPIHGGFRSAGRSSFAWLHRVA